ncbi:hypothetical protein V3738_004732 [Enterobacter roggenkampii]
MLTNDQIIENLERVGSLLLQKNIITDETPFRNIRRQFQNDAMKYSIPWIEFKKVKGEFVRSDVWDSDLSVKVNAEVQVREGFEFNSAVRMIVNIEYTCLSQYGEKECKGCWHMDYHVDEGEPQYMHPDYHLHHGGRYINGLQDYGEVIILDNPRVMHHPLDVFLAIDFVISNFYPKKEWSKIRADTFYKKIIKDAQRAWWKGYYEKISSYWERCDRNNKGDISNAAIFEAQKLNPHFI